MQQFGDPEIHYKIHYSHTDVRFLNATIISDLLNSEYLLMPATENAFIPHYTKHLLIGTDRLFYYSLHDWY